MHKARTAIVDALAALDLPGTSVEPYARDAIIDTPTLMVRVDRARPDTTAPRAWRRYEAAVLVLVPKVELGPADDQLDDFLEDVLYQIEQSRTLSWTVAERGVYPPDNPVHHGYEITLSVPVTKEP